MRPRIGVNCNVKPGLRRQNDGRLLALSPDFVAAISVAGGVPVLLPPFTRAGGVDGSAIDAALDAIDGLVLSGGDDIDPAAYGQPPHPRTVLLDPERDRSDLALAAAALRRGLPVLGVCGGMQLLNVVLGGTLHQHLADLRGGAYPRLHPIHDAQETDETSHAVEVEGRSRVGALLGAGRLDTNSRHHQAVDALGRGVAATARAEDGVIEAIESDDGEFVVGVQWHPEEHVGDARHGALFAGLVRAARNRTERRPDR